MKKILFTLILILGFSQIGNSQIINIPDANFKVKLLHANTTNGVARDVNGASMIVDTNGDGEIQVSEALQVYELKIDNFEITDLTGIEYFTNVIYLDCGLNSLTSMNISTLSNLISLTCFYNQLTSLNVSGLSALEQIHCSDNLISSLTFSQNDNLMYLNCTKNSLSSIDVSSLTNLEILYCGVNSLTNLDITNLTNLHTLDCSSNSLTSLNVSTLTDLASLHFHNNNISSIDLSPLVNLTHLNCNNNGITSLNINPSANLLVLQCSNNQISSLNVTDFTNLMYLDCNSNQLTSIDLTGLNSLTYFSCNHNLFTNLDVSPLTNLEFLYYGNDGLAGIDLVNQVDLKRITAYNLSQLPTNLGNLQNLELIVILMSELIEIDLSNVPSLKGFGAMNNLQLTYVNLKNGNNFTDGIQFGTNPNLMFACVNENDINNVISNGSNDGFHISSYCTFEPGGNYNTISGTITFDFNNNGCDENDNVTILTKVNINDGTEEGVSFTDINGEYVFFTQNGTFTLNPEIENPSYFNITPITETVSFADNNNNEEIVNFCITPNGVHPDLEVVIAPLIPARPGFEATYKIVYRNKGNQVLSQDYGLSFVYNQNLMNFVSASVVPDTQGPGGMNWSYENLMPFENREIVVTMQINPPTHPDYPVNIDDILTFTSVIMPQAGDENVQDNTYVFNQTVVGAYDPNDITCIEGDVVHPDYIGEELHYVIRFENTGNFYAENVVVVMEIDPAKYDVSSLRVLNSSHDVRAQVRGNTAEFFFNEIYLDSGGHGNILLVMKSANMLSEGDSVQSKADIYFDYNYPIITNDAVTVFEAELSLNDPVLSNMISVYPNPAKDIVNISSEVTIKSYELFDVSGRLVKTGIVNQTEVSINLNQQNSGIYFLRINTENGSILNKIIRE